MIGTFKNSHKESYITNCTIAVDFSNDRPPLFSDNEKGELIVKLDRLWLIDEAYLTDDMKSIILKAVGEKTSNK